MVRANNSTEPLTHAERVLLTRVIVSVAALGDEIDQRALMALWERFQPDGPTPDSPPPPLLLNAERTVMVREWADGTTEVVTREDPGASWGPPVVVTPEAPA